MNPYQNNQQLPNPNALMQDFQRFQTSYQQELAKWQQKLNQAKQTISQAMYGGFNPQYTTPGMEQQPVQGQPQQEIPPHIQQLTVLGEIKELLTKNNELMSQFVSGTQTEKSCKCDTEKKVQQQQPAPQPVQTVQQQPQIQYPQQQQQ